MNVVGTDERRMQLRLTGAVVALAASTTLLAAPAKADVIQIAEDGTPVILASDRPAEPTMGGSANAFSLATDGFSSYGLSIPAAAITVPLASNAPGKYAAYVAEAATTCDLAPSLIEAIIWQESRWVHERTSSAGAIGLMQIMPGTARDLKIDPWNPRQNIVGGACYFRGLLDDFNGNVELALAAYNSGPGRVRKAGGVPAISETRNYVSSISGRLATITLKGQ